MVFSFLCTLIAVSPIWAQDKPVPVSLIELLANPKPFDGKVVTAKGFLRIGHEPKHGFATILYLHEEDANNLLDNGLWVIPSKQMIADQEKIDAMYVMLTGVVKGTPTMGNSYTWEITNVQNCVVWSNPKRPGAYGINKAE